jgi:hypothetical protein
MISHDDITELKRVFDERYVRQTVCAEKQEEVNKKFSNDNTRIALLISQQKFNNWLTLAIAGGIVALVLKVYLGG